MKGDRKILNTIILILIAFFMQFCISAAFADQLKKSHAEAFHSGESFELSKPLIKAIQTNFPKMRVPAKSEVSDELTNPNNPNANPIFIQGDFNGDGLLDAALILVDDKQRILVIFEQKNGLFYPAYQRTWDIPIKNVLGKASIKILIKLVNKGEEWGQEGGDIPEKYKHEFDAVAIEVYQEKKFYSDLNLSLVYWDNGKYKEYGR